MSYRKRQRIYWRAGRAYADFRDYADVGGGQERLVVPGEKLATTDRKAGEVLAAQRLEELDRLRAQRHGRAVHRLPKETALAAFAAAHLKAKSESGKFTERWLESSERQLMRAVQQFGVRTELESISVADVRLWATALQHQGLSGGTVRHHLNTLSNLYRRAQAEGHVAPGYNPVAALIEKPSAQRTEAKWLEVPQAALLLESARTYQPKREHVALPFAYPLLATFLLTGGRRAEVLGLQVDDVSFDRKTVTFRPNCWRRLKTPSSFRTVPLWAQLEETLQPYVFGDRPPSRLLFPSYVGGREAMLVDFRKLIDAVATRAGWHAGEITSKIFRHTYCAARLQTLDHGAPVSVYTVAKELGHGGEAMVRRVYGHLGTVHHRSEVVEYRVEQHVERLRERLEASGLGPRGAIPGRSSQRA